MLDDCPTFCSQIFFAAALGLIKRHLGCVATTSVPTLAAESLWHNCAHATVSLRVTRRKKKLLQFFPGLEVCKKANHRWCLDDKFNPFIYLRPKKTLFWHTFLAFYIWLNEIWDNLWVSGVKMFQSKSFEAFTAGRHRLESGSSTINSLPSDISNKFVACDGAPAKKCDQQFYDKMLERW